MRNEVSVEIDRPIEEVFRLTNEHIAEWSIVVVEDEVLDKKTDGGVGTTFRTVTENRGKRMEFMGVVTRHEPPHACAVHMTSDMLDIETEFTFQDLSGRTRVTQNASVTGRGYYKLFMFLFGWIMNKSNCESSVNELNNLKKFCESYSDPAIT